MTNIQNNRKPGSGKKWVGIVFLILGTIMFSRTLGLYIPRWVTSWPMILIAIGIFTGVRHQFRNPSSYILIAIGMLFLADRIIPEIDFHDFFFPMVIIGVGLFMIVGRNRKDFNLRNEWTNLTEKPKVTWDKRVDPETGEPVEDTTGGTAASQEDYLDTVSIFGAVKKNIVSKDFKGGEMVTIMGGAEINLSQADITSPKVILDITQVFGGTKIIVPPHWKISSDLVALFGGIEDKRHILAASAISDEKHLVIKGTSIFGGIDIRSF